MFKNTNELVQEICFPFIQQAECNLNMKVECRWDPRSYLFDCCETLRHVIGKFFGSLIKYINIITSSLPKKSLWFLSISWLWFLSTVIDCKIHKGLHFNPHFKLKMLWSRVTNWLHKLRMPNAAVPCIKLLHFIFSYFQIRRTFFLLFFRF